MALAPEELARRVGLLKKLKQNLLLQREKFQNYMKVLDAEKDSIENDQMDHLETQVKIEESLVLEIHQFQKVIDPLEEVLHHSYPQENDTEVVEIKTSLENLRQQVLEKNQSNRKLLSTRMDEVRGEILRLRPKNRGKNPYGSSSQVSTLVDITT